MNDFPSRINYDENSELDQYSQDFMIKGEQEYKDIDNIANEVFNHPSQVNNGFNGNYHNKDHDIEVSNSSNEFQSNYQPEFGPNDYQNDSHDNSNQENIDIQNISFNIPGAFKNNDMEIDESPAFTIELDLYFDTQSQNTVNRESLSEINRRDLFPQNGYVNRQQFLDARQPSNTLILGLTGNNLGNGNNNHHILSTPTPSSAIQFDTPNSNSHQFMTFDNQHDNNSIYSSFLNDNEISSFHDQHIRTQSIDGSNYNPTSLAVNPNNPNGLNIGVYQNYNDLSPLTTTTSLSASINSLHSNQPSFFSAHQYLPRHSIEITNSNRNSIDQNSINSHNQNSLKRNVSGRYLNFNSISNYIPFMNDKEKSRNNNGDDNQRHSPSSNGPPSPLSQAPTSLFSNSNAQPTPRQQSKHLIRSIFKSNPMNDSNNLNNNQHSEGIINGNVNFNIDPPLGPGLNNDEETTDYTSSEFLMMSPTKEEMEDSLDPLPTKKAKRTKRSLFNRFKGPKQDDINTSTNSGGSGNLSELEQIENSSKNSGNNSFHEDETDHHSFHGNMSRTPSSANTVGTHNNNNNNTIASNGNFTNNNLDPTNLDNSGNTSNGPDYAALFENVGKRKPKKVSKPSTTLSFTKSKLKLNKENEETENSSFNNEVQLNNLLDNGSLSISTSNTSHSHNPNNYYGQSSGPIQQQQELKTKQELIIDENEIINRDDEQLLDQDEDEDGSTLVNASKRILGSKLMKRKANKKEADIKNVKTKISGGQGVEVEVDLKTLDLPETTQVYPTNIVNAKSSVRGRKENKEADLTDLTKIYLCNYCSRRFKRQEHLKRHFRSLHTFEKPYDCEICHKKFSRSDNLNQHLKVHKQEEEMKLQNMS